MGIKMFTKTPPWYAKYEEAKVDRSTIMQDFRDHEKKIQMAHWRPFFDFFSTKFVMGYPCVGPCILFYIHGPALLHFFRATLLSHNY